MSQSTEEWEKKLLGKVYVAPGDDVPNGKETFSNSDITVDCFRILGPNSMMTMDYNIERLTVIINGENVCTSVGFS